MRAAFGRERHAARGGDKDESGVLITGIVERIEAALDERIVQRANRNEPHAEQRMGQTGSRQKEKQIVLGNPQLDMLARRPHLPALRTHQAAFLEDVRSFFACEKPAPVDPRAQIGRNRHVGRGREDAPGEFAVSAPDIGENAAKAFLSGSRARFVRGGNFFHFYTARLQTPCPLGREWNLLQKGI